jgi:hypothetical protein
MQVSLPANKRLPIITFLIALGFVSSIASAAPVALDCRASGPAGAVTFRFIFDDAAKQASTTWSAGGGRPFAPVFGEAGTDNSIDPAFTVSAISASFRISPVDDPYAHLINIGRTDGSMRFIRYNPLRISEGTCSPSAAPARLF